VVSKSARLRRAARLDASRLCEERRATFTVFDDMGNFRVVDLRKASTAQSGRWRHMAAAMRVAANLRASLSAMAHLTADRHRMVQGGPATGFRQSS
jgi:hypothetical protein